MSPCASEVNDCAPQHFPIGNRGRPVRGVPAAQWMEETAGRGRRSTEVRLPVVVTGEVQVLRERCGMGFCPPRTAQVGCRPLAEAPYLPATRKVAEVPRRSSDTVQRPGVGWAGSPPPHATARQGSRWSQASRPSAQPQGCAPLRLQLHSIHFASVRLGNNSIAKSLPATFPPTASSPVDSSSQGLQLCDGGSRACQHGRSTERVDDRRPRAPPRPTAVWAHLGGRAGAQGARDHCLVGPGRALARHVSRRFPC